MIKNLNIEEFKAFQKNQMYLNFLKNQKRKNRRKKKAKAKIMQYNKNINIIPFGVSKVYELKKLHNLINWYKYYIELYLEEYFYKIQTIKDNKIEL